MQPQTFEGGAENESFQCRLATPFGDTLLKGQLCSSSNLSTSAILQEIITLSLTRSRRDVKSFCSLFRASDNVNSESEDKYVLRCRILSKSATDLLGGIPFNSKNIFDRHANHRISQRTYDAWKPEDFYSHVHVPRLGDSQYQDPPADRNLDLLRCQLYPFQKRALQWLLRREGVQMAAGGTIVEYSAPASGNRLPHGFSHARDADGTSCFVSHCLSIATKNQSLLEDNKLQLRGGILAEEMGLGKTVEMIALMCIHKRDSTLINSSTAPTGLLAISPATLIITPAAIL